MALAHRTRQSGDAATRWPIMAPTWTQKTRRWLATACRVAALSLWRVLCARAIN